MLSENSPIASETRLQFTLKCPPLAPTMHSLSCQAAHMAMYNDMKRSQATVTRSGGCDGALSPLPGIPCNAWRLPKTNTTAPACLPWFSSAVSLPVPSLRAIPRPYTGDDALCHCADAGRLSFHTRFRPPRPSPPPRRQQRRRSSPRRTRPRSRTVPSLPGAWRVREPPTWLRIRLARRARGPFPRRARTEQAVRLAQEGLQVPQEEASRFRQEDGRQICRSDSRRRPQVRLRLEEGGCSSPELGREATGRRLQEGCRRRAEGQGRRKDLYLGRQQAVRRRAQIFRQGRGEEGQGKDRLAPGV